MRFPFKTRKLSIITHADRGPGWGGGGEVNVKSILVRLGRDFSFYFY